jgi:arylsulfatase A-like enzyme
LAKRGDAPAFLFVHLYDPHWPYNPPADVPEWIFAGTSEEDRQEVNRYTDAFDLAMALAVGPPALTEAAKALYRGEIWSADHALGDLFALVRQRGRPAYVVVVSDHGELFGEHDMRGHGITLFEGEVRVPCLVAGPEIPPGLPVAGNANLIDLAPALLDLMRLSPLPHTREPGLAAALRGGPTPPPRWLGGENHSISTLPIRYVTDGVWKWFSGMDQQVRTAYLRYAEAAYRVDSDPDEAVNRLADSGVPGFREIAGALFGGAATSERHVTLDPAERERLRALGYLP